MPTSDYDRGRLDALHEAVELLIASAGQARLGSRSRVDYVRGALVVQGLQWRVCNQAQQSIRRSQCE